MKTLPRLLFLALGFIAVSLRAADDAAVIAAVRAADDERVAATMSADPARIDAIYSDDLHYGHSSAKVDTKASYKASLVAHTTVYSSYEYSKRDFRIVAPGIVIMTGRALIHSSNGAEKVSNDLNFLAVWRQENGKWRFLAWQSVKNPPAAK